MNFDGIVDKIQVILKTDVRYLMKGGFWLVVGQFFSSASAFLVAVAFANLLPKEIYGDYRYVLSIFSLLLIPTLTSMDTAVVQAVARGYEGVFKPAFKAKVRWSLIGVAASFGCAVYYFFNHNEALTLCFAIIAIFIPFSESFDMYNAILQGRQEFRQFTKYNSLTQLISAAFSIITAFYSQNLAVLIVVFVASNTFLNLLFLWLTIKKRPLNSRSDPQTINYGKHLSVMDIFGTAVNQLDKILVFHYLGAIDLAIYSLAIAPPEQIKALFKNISFLAMPRFAQRTTTEVQETLFPRLIKFGLIVTLIVSAYIFAAPFVYHIFFKNYPESVFYSQIVAISIVPVAMTLIPISFIQARAAKQELYQYNIFANVLIIVVLLPCLYFWGLFGAIIARIISRCVTLIIAIFLAYRLKDN